MTFWIAQLTFISLIASLGIIATYWEASSRLSALGASILSRVEASTFEIQSNISE